MAIVGAQGPETALSGIDHGLLPNTPVGQPTEEDFVMQGSIVTRLAFTGTLLVGIACGPADAPSDTGLEAAVTPELVPPCAAAAS